MSDIPETTNLHQEEIHYWRLWFLDKYQVTDKLACNVFLYNPSENLIQLTPEENLIECLSYSLNHSNNKNLK